jgi:hypothetical protein
MSRLSDPGSLFNDQFMQFIICIPQPIRTYAKTLGLSSSRLLSHLFSSVPYFFFISFLARYLYKLSYSFVRYRAPAQLLHLNSLSITQRSKRIVFMFSLSLYLENDRSKPNSLSQRQTNICTCVCIFNGRDILIYLAAIYPNVTIHYTRISFI